MAPSDTLQKFFFPSLTKRFFLRIFLLVCATWFTFSFLLIPLHIEGKSMVPTYQDGSFALCWRMQYLFTPPKRGDVVTVRFAGKNVMLLKRIVGLAGDTVSFKNGQLYINNTAVPEPYVVHNSQWQLPERRVKPEHVYVVGDNRGTSMQRHKFGQVKSKRIIGGVIP
jgi:signal peptidase I